MQSIVQWNPSIAATIGEQNLGATLGEQYFGRYIYRSGLH